MSLSSGVRAVSTLMEAASEQRLLPQGCEEQNDTA
jgi:hypothetical protein